MGASFFWGNENASQLEVLDYTTLTQVPNAT